MNLSRKVIFSFFFLVFIVGIMGWVSANPIISYVNTTPLYPNNYSNWVYVNSTIIPDVGTIISHVDLSYRIYGSSIIQNDTTFIGPSTGGSSNNYSAGIFYQNPQDGILVQYHIKAVDNTSSYSWYPSSTTWASFVYDGSAPIVDVSGAPSNLLVTKSGVTASVSCVDSISGCNSSTYALVTSSISTDCSTLNYAGAPSTMPVMSQEYICARVTDNAGNIGYSNPVQFNVFNTIQSAIGAASPSDTINIEDGTYSETLDINKPLTLIGESKIGVIINAISSSDYGIDITANGVTVEKLTLIGPNNNYGFKPSHINNLILRDLNVQGSGKTGIDLNTINGATLNNIKVTDTVSGFGLMILDSNDVTVTDITTSGNVWGGVSVQTANAVSDNIDFLGTFNVLEANPLLLEKDPSTYYDITNVDIPTKFQYVIYGFRNEHYKPATSSWVVDNYQQWFYQKTFDNAKTFAQELIAAEGVSVRYSDMIIYDIAEKNYYVVERMLIQDAITAATVGDTINVGAGTYAEYLDINKPLILQGAGIGNTILNMSSEVNPSSIQNVIDIGLSSSGNVVINGFEIRLGDNMNAIESGLRDSSSTTTITNNKIMGYRDTACNNVEDFGIYIHDNEAKTIINNNEINTNCNPILLERAKGESKITDNILFAKDNSAGIFLMTLSGIDIISLQNISGNTINILEGGTGGIGIRTSPSWTTASNGKFTNIKITNNVITNVISNTYGIKILNDKITAPETAVIDGTTITGNTITGLGGTGIILGGLVIDTRINDNTISGVNEGIHIDNGNTGNYPTRTFVNENLITGSITYGLNWLGSELLNAQDNWWGFNVQSLIAPLVSGNVDYTPWAYNSNVDIDHVTPLISILYPLNTLYSDLVSQLNYSASDSPSGLYTCWYSTDDGVTNSTLDATCSNFSGLLSSEGSNTWKVYAVDKSGNINSTIVQFTQDTIAPFINITSPINGTVTDSMSLLTIIANTSDSLSGVKNVTLTLSNSTRVVSSGMMSSGTSGYEYPLFLGSLPAGSYIIRVNATDNAGNMDSTTSNFTITNNVAQIGDVVTINGQVSAASGGTVNFVLPVIVRGNGTIKFSMDNIMKNGTIVLTPSGMNAIISNGSQSAVVGSGINFIGATSLTLTDTNPSILNIQSSITLSLSIPGNNTIPSGTYSINYYIENA